MKFKVLSLIIYFLFLVPGNLWAQDYHPQVQIVDRGFVIDKEHKEGPREVRGVPVEQVDSNYAYEWDFNKTAKTWVYANAWIGDVEAWVKGTFYVDFVVTGLPEGYSFIAPQIRAKIKSFGLVDSFGYGDADTNYKIEMIAGLKDLKDSIIEDFDWSNAIRKATIFTETDKETWMSWDFVADMATAAAGALISEIPVVGDTLDVVWQVASTAWDAVDCDAKVAKTGWVRFINVPLKAGKRYRIFLSNETHVKAVAVGAGSRSIKIDFFKKQPFFTHQTKNLTGWGFGIEDVEVVIPQSVYDYLNQMASQTTPQPEVVQEEVKPDLYFSQRPKIYPSYQITPQDTPQIEVFVSSRNKKVENVKVKIEIPDIGWQETSIFSLLLPGKVYSQKIPLPRLPLPSGASSHGYQINIIIDPDEQIDEATRFNNEDFLGVEVIPTMYQLKALSIWVEPVSGQYNEGDSVLLKGRVINRSNVGLDNVEVKFYYNAKDPQNRDLKEIAKKVISLNKFEEKTVSCRWQVKKADFVWTEIYFIVDPENKIKEQDESRKLHEAQLAIKVKKVEVTEKPLEEESLKEGVDLAIDSKDIFLDKENLIASSYLGVWVKNKGKERANLQLKFTGYWIKRHPDGKSEIKTAILGNLGGNIPGGKSKLYKFYYKDSPYVDFIFSKNLKIVIEAITSGDVDSSNNAAVFKIGNFDAVARQIREAEQREKEELSKKPDLAIIDIKNLTPALEIGRSRTFQVVIKNVSNLDIRGANIDCVIRPKGSGRPHPELGWRKYQRHIAPVSAGKKTSIYIDYTPVRKGVYEIVASVNSIRFGEWKIWQKDGNRANDTLLKYFGVETSLPQPQPAETGAGALAQNLDLAVTNIWIDNKTPNVGEVITGGFVVHNNSNSRIENIDWVVYSNDHKIAEGKIAGLDAGSSYTVTASSEADEEGIFTVKAVVDPYNKIKETDEQNNYKEIRLGVEEESLISLPQIDLAVVSLKLKKSTIKVAETTKAVAEIKNLGKDTAYGVVVNFQVNDKTFFVNVIDELKSGQSKRVSAPVVGLMGGKYTIRVSVDRRNLIKELNEDNNEKRISLNVRPLIKLPKNIKNIFNILK